MNDTVSLIRQTGSREWEVLDLVADEADWPLSQQTLEAMAGTEHSPRQAFAIFLTMYTGRTLDNENSIAKQILQETDEFLYKITTKLTPNSNLFDLYAFFLTDVRHDYDRAESMFERAITADPNHANTLGNYSQILFATGRDEAATALATRALPLADPDEKPLVAECHFYLFAHSPQHRRKSGKRLRDLLAAGVTTGSWSFEPDLERLRREKDPRYDLVRDVADALRSGDARTLEARGEWYAL